MWNQRLGLSLGLLLLPLPILACRLRGARQIAALLFQRHDVAHPRIARLHRIDLLRQAAPLFEQRVGQALDACLQLRRALEVNGAHCRLVRIVEQAPLEVGDPLEHRSVHQLRHRHLGGLVGEHGHRNEVGDDQDQVLRHLGPGHRAHAAQEGAHQNPGQADEDADLELQPDETAGDDADAVNLRHHIDEGGDHGGQHADEARGVTAVARAEVLGDGVLPETAQIGCKQQGDEDVAARPAHHVGQPLIAGVVERPGQADEGRGAHPVGAGRHAVEERRDAPAGNVVLGNVGGARQDADRRVEQDGHAQEGVADPARRHAVAFEPPQGEHESDEAEDVEDVVAAQPRGRVDHRRTAREMAACAPGAAFAWRRAWPRARSPCVFIVRTRSPRSTSMNAFVGAAGL